MRATLCIFTMSQYVGLALFQLTNNFPQQPGTNVIGEEEITVNLRNYRRLVHNYWFMVSGMHNSSCRLWSACIAFNDDVGSHDVYSPRYVCLTIMII